MGGIYIPGMEMPEDEGDSIHILRDGTVVVYRTGSIGFYRAVPVPDHGQLLNVLKTERECVSRDCDRDCGKCDLALDREEILAAYDALIAMLSTTADEETCDG